MPKKNLHLVCISSLFVLATLLTAHKSYASSHIIFLNEYSIKNNMIKFFCHTEPRCYSDTIDSSISFSLTSENITVTKKHFLSTIQKLTKHTHHNTANLANLYTETMHENISRATPLHFLSLKPGIYSLIPESVLNKCKNELLPKLIFYNSSCNISKTNISPKCSLQNLKNTYAIIDLKGTNSSCMVSLFSQPINILACKKHSTIPSSIITYQKEFQKLTPEQIKMCLNEKNTNILRNGTLIPIKKCINFDILYQKNLSLLPKITHYKLITASEASEQTFLKELKGTLKKNIYPDSLEPYYTIILNNQKSFIILLSHKDQHIIATTKEKNIFCSLYDSNNIPSLIEIILQ